MEHILTIIKRKILLALIFTFVGSQLLISGEKTKGIDTDLKPQTSRVRVSNPKMDYTLWRLYTLLKSEGPEAAAEFAGKRCIRMNNTVIIVNIQTDFETTIESIYFNDLKTALEHHGGLIQGYGFDSIEILLPLSALEEIASLENVKYISLPKRPVTEITSEGVDITGAQYLINSVPYKTNSYPVKVAVIDVGFDGYESLVGSELPQETNLVSFMYYGGPGYIKHGTACAEVIYDMSPDTILYLMPIDNYFDLLSAVNYCIDNDIKVISTSLCWFRDGPKDGTGMTCEIMRYAYENGIIWVTGAGNYAARHYAGYISDTDSDGWHNFSSNDEVLDLNLTNVIEFNLFFEWDDWGTWNGKKFSGTGEDFDLYFYKWNGTDWELIATSENVQNGDDSPFEFIGLSYPENGHYGIAIKRISGNKSVKLHLYFSGIVQEDILDSQYIVSEQSICAGADSRHVITVGAFNSYDLQLTWYSSWGPTLDGRIKPDITAPSFVSTASSMPYTFGGTSAATPHAAGAVALLMSRLPFSTFEDILSILAGRAIEEGEPGKDNKWGYGRLYLGK